MTASETATADTNSTTSDAATAPDDTAPPKIEPGIKVTGTITRLADFGAFVALDGGNPGADAPIGLVHISEVAPEFIDNIYAHLAEGQQVDVAVLAVNDDKIKLSIKRLDPNWRDDEQHRPTSTVNSEFEDMLNNFLHRSQRIQGEARRQRRNRLGTDRRRS